MRLCLGCKIALLCTSSETVFDRAKINDLEKGFKHF